MSAKYGKVSEAYAAQHCAGLFVILTKLRVVGVRAEGELSAAVVVIFAEDFLGGEERGVGVDFEGFAALDDAVQDGVELLGEVGVFQHLLLVGRSAQGRDSRRTSAAWT